MFLLIREGQNDMNTLEFLGNTESGSEGLFVLCLASPFFKLSPNLCVSCLIVKLLKAGCTFIQALYERMCVFSIATCLASFLKGVQCFQPLIQSGDSSKCAKFTLQWQPIKVNVCSGIFFKFLSTYLQQVIKISFESFLMFSEPYTIQLPLLHSCLLFGICLKPGS